MVLDALHDSGKLFDMRGLLDGVVELFGKSRHLFEGRNEISVIGMRRRRLFDEILQQHLVSWNSLNGLNQQTFQRLHVVFSGPEILFDRRSVVSVDVNVVICLIVSVG